MGFFDSASKFLNGGSDSRSNSQAQSGFALLPPELQAAFKNYASGVTNQFADPAATTAMYTPLGQTQSETNALATINNGGVTPTADSLKSDIAMQMNPFNDSVINGINKQANGQYSILKQAENNAGQMGSNRDLLGANDIDLSRLDQIGTFQQNEYNTALQNSLGALTNSRQNDINNDFTAGTFQRGLDAATKQAPVAGLQSFGQLLGALPQTGGSTSTSDSNSSTSNGAGGTIASLAALFSDRRLKRDIKLVGKAGNGLGIYEFSYKGDPDDHRFRGVMAQDVQEIMPEAVGEMGGFLVVNYNTPGIPMMEAC